MTLGHFISNHQHGWTGLGERKMSMTVSFVFIISLLICICISHFFFFNHLHYSSHWKNLLDLQVLVSSYVQRKYYMQSVVLNYFGKQSLLQLASATHPPYSNLNVTTSNTPFSHHLAAHLPSQLASCVLHLPHDSHILAQHSIWHINAQ